MRCRSINKKSTLALPLLSSAAQNVAASSRGCKQHLPPRTGRRKAFSVRALMAIAAMLAPVSAWAGPLGEQYKGGDSLVTRPDNTTTLIQQQSQKAVIEWNSFSIGSNEKVKVEQPGTDSILLNRVVGSSPSEIFGSLTANGQVFVVNPHGVVFAPGAQVDVHGLMATTLDITPTDFMAVSAGNYIFTNVADGQVKNVSNQGTLTAAEGGYIVLAGDTVDNSGSITAQSGQVALVSGSKMTLDLAGDQLISLEVDLASLATTAGVKNTATGVLMADGGRVVMTAKSADTLIGTVVNNQGQIQARTIQEANGEVWLEGTIRLEGDKDHGTVAVAGTLDASAPTGGNGGTIETAGHRVTVADNTTITAAADTTGARGEWRLRDEVDFFIGADGAAMLDGGGMSGTTLSNALETTHVVIERTGLDATSGTTAATANKGDIVVNANVQWATNSILKLKASNDVKVLADITNTGLGEVVLRGDADANNHGTVDFTEGNVSGSLTTGGMASIFYTPDPDSSYAQDRSRYLSFFDGIDTGNLTTYILINSIDQLQVAISNDLGASYALGKNIDAIATQGWFGGGFNPLGQEGNPFSGTFTGDGHTITGLYINTTNNTSSSFIKKTGLFGVVAVGSEIRDVGLIDAKITGTDYVGGLVGYNGGDIRNAYSTGTITGQNYVGGLIGLNELGAIDNTHSTTQVTGSSDVGGLIGYSGEAEIRNSFSTSTVTGTYRVGGLIGQNYSGAVNGTSSAGTVSGSIERAGGLIGFNDFGQVTNSFSTSDVDGGNYVGGLIGYNNTAGSGGINGTYSNGKVTSSGGTVGGLIGADSNEGLSAVDSYWDQDNSGQAMSAGGNPLSTEQMMQQESFAQTTWDFANTWRIYEGMTSPLLKAFLTPLTIKVKDETRVYGDANPEAIVASYYDPSAATYLDPLTLAEVKGDLLPIFEAEQMSSVGNYGITPSGLYSTTYDITFVNGSLSISPRPLGVEIKNASKTYDQSPLITLTPENLFPTNNVNNDPVTIPQTVEGTFDGANADAHTVTAMLAEMALGNYVIQAGTIATGTGTIAAKPVTWTSPTAKDKTYDGTLVADIVKTSGNLDGILPGDDGKVLIGSANGNFDSKDVGNNIGVTITGIALGGAAAGNYTVNDQAQTTATINPAPLSAVIIGNPSKIFDETTTATLSADNFQMSGFVGDEKAVIPNSKTIIGLYDSPEVGSHTVSSALTEADFSPNPGTTLTNYQFPVAATGNGTITAIPAPEKPPVIDEGTVIKEKAKDEVVGVTAEIIASTLPEDLTKESMQSEGGSKGAETANGEGDSADENKEKEKKVGGTDSDQENELQEQPLLSLDSGAVAGQNMVCK